MNLVAFTTGRRDGDARAPGALKRLLKKRGLPSSIATVQQIHGIRIHIVPKMRSAKKFPSADGLLTEAEDQPLGIFAADCVPVFLSAGESKVIGLLHAGWRGVHRKILATAVRLIRRRWHIPASGVLAWTGPSISPCCFGVRWDVARHFPTTRKRRGDLWSVDLAGELKRQGRKLRVSWTQKNRRADCTMHGIRHYSYRRDKTEKRHVSVMMKRNER